MKKILITDSLFIFKEHEEKLRAAGYDIERLDKPNASEEELIQAVKGKEGYILGGIEKVTDKVINAADQLKAIAFTGTDHVAFIPGHTLATKKGICISTTPAANAYAVAEYTIAIILSMTRDVFDLTRVGEKKFGTTTSLKDLTVGIVGMGVIGKRVTSMLNGLGVKKILYYSPHQKNDVRAEYTTMEKVFTESDIVSLHASTAAGFGFIDKSTLSLMKDNSLIVNCSFTGAMNAEDLYVELQSGRLRAFQDDPINERFDTLPTYNWMCSNMHTAYNTEEANRVASDMATTSLLNLLKTGTDTYKVN